MADSAKPEQIVALAQRAHDNFLAQHKVFNEARIADARVAMQALLLINGGSATAVLTFAGNLATKTSSTVAINTFSWCLGTFGIGVASAGACAVLAYLTNHAVAEAIIEHDTNYVHPFVHPKPAFQRKQQIADRFHQAAMGAALVSLSAFIIGACTAAVGLSHIG